MQPVDAKTVLVLTNDIDESAVNDCGYVSLPSGGWVQEENVLQNAGGLRAF